MTINRVLYNIMTTDLGGTRDFYLHLLDMHLLYESDWYIVLKPSDDSPHELGIIDVNSEVVPEDFRAAPQGSYVTFVVDDVLKTFSRAKDLGVNIVQERLTCSTDSGGCCFAIRTACSWMFHRQRRPVDLLFRMSRQLYQAELMMQSTCCRVETRPDSRSQ